MRTPPSEGSSQALVVRPPRARLFSASGPEAGVRRAEPVHGSPRAGTHQNNHLGLIGERRRRQEGGREDHVTEPPSP